MSIDVKQLGFAIAVLPSCKGCPRYGKGIEDCLDYFDTMWKYHPKRGFCPRREKAETFIETLVSEK